MTDWTAGLPEARALVAGARRLVFSTGAGISAESGVPTFRGEGGLWRSHRPEELATPSAFAADPRLVWEWYAWRRELVRACEPNAAHLAIGRALAEGRITALITQNVDGLHARALDAVSRPGPATENEPHPAAPAGEALPTHAPPSRTRSSPQILQLHGSLFQVRCSQCDHAAPSSDEIDASTVASLPRCPDCGALLRPAVVWFGERLDEVVLETAFSAVQRADVFVVVGTSGLVEPAASLPRLAASSGGKVIEVNPDSTPITGLATVALKGAAGEIVPRLLDD